MKRIEAIVKMKGAVINTAPIEVESELIFSWDIDLNLNEFSDEQIEAFYDAELEDENEKKSTK